MSKRLRPGGGTLPLMQARLVDDTCGRFEAAWQTATDPEQRPRIEAFLAGVPEIAQSALLSELVMLEIELRRLAGESPQSDEYRARFPSVALPDETTRGVERLEPGMMGLPNVHIPGYDIIQELGRGGMGMVYWAWQTRLHRAVALKMILAGAHASAEDLTRFNTEAEAVARLDHPNIVHVYEVGWQESCPYMALEYVEGGSLAKRLSGTPQPAREAAKLIELLARAVHYAHERGIVHRDLTPANVLLTAAGVPKITDFGLAKLIVGGGPTLTQSGAIMGTPSYMAPEQAMGKASLIGPATDIYALGSILYEMITGRPPFKAESSLETILQVQSIDPISPTRLQPKLSRDLATIAMKCLAKEPDKRYKSALALAEDLDRFLTGNAIHARPIGQAERLWRWCKRNPVVAALTAAVLLLLVALTVGALLKSAELALALADSEEANRMTALALADSEEANRKTALALADSEEANRQAKAKLWESLRNRARAMRMTQGAGQRVEGLRSIRQALELPAPAGHSIQELQTEAIAALALPDLELVHEWEGFPPANVGLDFDGTLEHYARLGIDGTVSVFRIQGDVLIASWRETTKGDWPYGESNVRVSPDGRFVATRHNGSESVTVRRLEGKSGVVYHRSAAGARVHSYWAMDYSPDSRRLAYILTDGRIAMVDLYSGKTSYLRATATTGQDSIRFAPDGRRFAVSVERGQKYTVEVRDAATGQVQRVLPHPNSTNHPTWHPDGQILATSCNDKVIRLWNVATGQVLRELKGHKNLGIKCAFSRTGDRLVSNDWSSLLRVWDPSSGLQLLAFPASGFEFLRVGGDDLVSVFNVADITKLQLLRLHTGLEYRTITLDGATASQGIVFGEMSIKVHPGGRLFAATTVLDQAVRVLDLRTGREVANLGSSSLMALHWDKSGDLFTCGQQGLVLWPVRADPADQGRYRFGPPKVILPNTSDKYKGRDIRGVWGCSANCKVIAVPFLFDNDGALLVHFGKTLPSRLTELKPQRDVRKCAVSPDGRWVATGSHNSQDGFGVKIWNANTGKMVKALPLPGLNWVTFSPDGKWLLTTSGGCRLWKVDSWEEVQKIDGMGGCFSPDGAVLAMGEGGGAVRLVDPQTGTTFARLEAPEQTRLMPRCFTPDGSQLIALGVETQMLHVWDLRAVLQGLRELGLVGDLRPYPPPTDPGPTQTLRVDVDWKAK